MTPTIFLILHLLNGGTITQPMASLALCQQHVTQWQQSAQAKDWLDYAECKAR